MAGAAQMLEGDFDAACAAYANALAALATLGEHAQLPPPLPAPATPAASPWDDMARVEQRLWEVLAGLKVAQLQAFPLFGTLLGLVRGGALLPFDKDLDLGAWIEDYRAVCAHLRALGMRDAPLTPPYDNFCTFIDPSTNLVFDVTSLAAATLAFQAASTGTSSRCR